MAELQYIALIGDLVASKELSATQRHDLQVRLMACLESVPTGPDAGVAARPLVTLGDEFQALFHADEAGIRGVLDLILSTLEAARPTAVRYGLGVGTLATALQQQALGMDGPCFHRARRALTRARRQDLLCQLEIRGEVDETLWSTLAAYALRQRVGWTESQREAIALYDQLGAWNKVADRLQVSPSAVSLRHQAAGWALFRTAWEALHQGLAGAITAGSGDDDPGGGS